MAVQEREQTAIIETTAIVKGVREPWYKRTYLADQQELIGVIALVFIWLSPLIFIPLYMVLHPPLVTITLYSQSLHTHKAVAVSVPLQQKHIQESASVVAVATGKGHVLPHVASGMLTFYNGSSSGVTIHQGSLFTANNGMQFSLDQDVVVPAATPGQQGVNTGAAIATAYGTAGNIAMRQLNDTLGSSLFIVNEQGFTGGVNERWYHIFTKADYVRAITPLMYQLGANMARDIWNARTVNSTMYDAPTCSLSIRKNASIGTEAVNIYMYAAKVCDMQLYTPVNIRSLSFDLSMPLMQRKSCTYAPATMQRVGAMLMFTFIQACTFHRIYNGVSKAVAGTSMKWAYSYLHSLQDVHGVSVNAGNDKRMPNVSHIQVQIIYT